MQGILDRIRKKPRIPQTVLCLTVETEITFVGTGKPNMYELITIPRAVPRIVLKDPEGSGQKVNSWDWFIGYIRYNFERNFWCMDLSMNTAIFSAVGERVATGFNGEETHMGTCYGFHGDERIRYARIGLGMFRDEPYCFYPEIRVRIQDREAEQPRR